MLPVADSQKLPQWYIAKELPEVFGYLVISPFTCDRTKNHRCLTSSEPLPFLRWVCGVANGKSHFTAADVVSMPLLYPHARHAHQNLEPLKPQRCLHMFWRHLVTRRAALCTCSFPPGCPKWLSSLRPLRSLATSPLNRILSLGSVAATIRFKASRRVNEWFGVKARRLWRGDLR